MRFHVPFPPLQEHLIRQEPPIEGLFSQGAFLDWSFVAGLFICGLLLLWILGQIRETRRLRWAKEVAAAIRRRNIVRLDELRLEAIHHPSLTLWSDMMSDLGELLKIDTHRTKVVKEDLGHWRERYQRLPVPAFVLEGDRRISAVNAELCWMLGRTEEELLGLRLADVTSAEPLDERYSWMEAFATRGEGTRSRLTRLLREDRSTLPVLLMSRPVFGKSASVLREYCTVLGLSDEPLQEQTRPAASDTNIEGMARLAGCVAHDFNDVLTSILGHGSFLQGSLDEEDPAREEVAEIMEAVETASQLTDQLLAFSRQEVLKEGELSGQTEHVLPTKTPASEDPTICVVEDDDSVRGLVASVLQREGYRVMAAGDGEEALEICAKAKRPIDLLLADVSLPGVNGPALYDRLREDFSDLKVLFTSGFVDEEVFHAELPGFQFLQKPFTPQLLLKRTKSILEAGRKNGERKLVLVVDDEASTRRLLESLLESLGFDCIVAEDGKEALEKLGATKVDAVITDMVMPKMDGIQTCTAIKEHFPELSFIAMSGKGAGAANLAAAEQLGAVATLSKPFSKDELLLALGAVFGGEEKGDGEGEEEEGSGEEPAQAA